VALALLLLLLPPAEEGYTFPPVRHGDLTARLSVRVSEAVGPNRVYYTLTVDGGPRLEVEAPELADTLSAWTPRRASAWTQEGGRASWTESIELEQAKPGLVALPDVKVRFRNGPKEPWQGAEWKDILKDIRELPGPDRPTTAAPGVLPRVAWATAGTVVLLVGALVLLRRRRAEPPLTPDGKALRDLDRLERAIGTPGTGGERLFTRLSDVVRCYLAERFGLPAFQQTTAEFLRAGAPPLAAEMDFLRDLFERCDLAKFAPLRADPERLRESIGQARAFVRRTATDTRAPVIPATQALTNRGP
jgi:hypothetical protein